MAGTDIAWQEYHVNLRCLPPSEPAEVKSAMLTRVRCDVRSLTEIDASTQIDSSNNIDSSQLLCLDTIFDTYVWDDPARKNELKKAVQKLQIGDAHISFVCQKKAPGAVRADLLPLHTPTRKSNTSQGIPGTNCFAFVSVLAFECAVCVKHAPRAAARAGCLRLMRAPTPSLRGFLLQPVMRA
eukprot:3193980-Rhodomonas_salina.1